MKDHTPTQFGKLLESVKEDASYEYPQDPGQEEPAAAYEPSPSFARAAFRALVEKGTDEEIMAVWNEIPSEGMEGFSYM